MTDADSPTRPLLPPDDDQRAVLHNEVHARPQARLRLPARVLYVAVLNEGVARESECEHLRRLPGQDALALQALDANFLRLQWTGHTLKWERHSEFTRYTLVQKLPPDADVERLEDHPSSVSTTLDPDWMPAIPGRTVAAVELTMVLQNLDNPQAVLAAARERFGSDGVVASMMGHGHSMAVTDFKLRESGFEHMRVIAPHGTSETRAGRIAARLLEVETYRLMALRGLPMAKSLGSMLGASERALADITARLDAKRDSDEALLDTLVALAARVESATAEHSYRFSATQAYATLVAQRIAELREQPVPGTQTIGEFMQRRLSPAMATVAATAQRLSALSQRVERAGALLRTRVDIAAEAQNQELLAKLTRGQELQLQLQSTVEGLSIAAISYYVVSLLLYAGKAANAAGLPIHPELAAGAAIPIVLWLVARTVRRIHARLKT